MASRGSVKVSKKEAMAMLSKMAPKVKTASAAKKLSDAMVKLNNTSKPRLPGMGPFAGVSQVSAAPVTIGNTIHSTALSIKRTKDGVIAEGRDYVQTIGGTANGINSWTLQGGMPVTPMALNASALRGYFQSHQEFRFMKLCAHFITSSPTSTSGDVMIMYHMNHGGPKVDHTSNNFLSYALSTESTVLGPQWTNHSIDIQTSGKWFDTDVLNSEDVQHQADGEILVYTKNTTNAVTPDSPGYFLIDYVVEFKGMMTNPRIASIPSGVFKWYPTAMFLTLNIAANEPVIFDFNTASTYTGFSGTLPPNTAIGTIFQIVLDFQNASYGTITAGNLPTLLSVLQARTGAGAVARKLPYSLGTGTTLYGVYRGATILDIYPSYPAVFAGNPLIIEAGFGVGSFFNCAAAVSAVGSVNATYLQANLG
jgi:hypothetical protein